MTKLTSRPCASEGRWQFWIDRGGTFTDIVALTPEGEIRTHKLLSEDPARYPDAALAGGEPGKPGRNAVIRADGRVEELPARARVEMAAGDQFVIETPGGGGVRGAGMSARATGPVWGITGPG